MIKNMLYDMFKKEPDISEFILEEIDHAMLIDRRIKEGFEVTSAMNSYLTLSRTRSRRIWRKIKDLLLLLAIVAIISIMAIAQWHFNYFCWRYLDRFLF